MRIIMLLHRDRARINRVFCFAFTLVVLVFSDQSPDVLSPVAVVTTEFIAANGLRLRYVTKEEKNREGDSIYKTTSKVTLQHVNASRLLAIVANETCAAQIAMDSCNFDELKSCTFWNLDPKRSHKICIRSEEDSMIDENANFNSTLEVSGAWTEVSMQTEFREPPMIHSCVVSIYHGHEKTTEENVLEIPYIEKDQIDISCRISGYPPPKVFWCKDSLKCNISNVVSDGMTVDSTGKLFIRKATAKHDGSIYCIAQNKYGKSVSPAINLRFTEILPFPANESPRKNTVSLGDSIRLECRYPKGNRVFHFSWSKVTEWKDPEPQKVIVNDRIVIGLDGSLMFLYTEREDSGKYMCTAMNPNVIFKTVSGSPSELEVTDDRPGFSRVPQLLTKSSEIMSAIVGETVKLQCVFGGKPIPDVLWSSDLENEMILPSDHFKLNDRNVTLIIENVRLFDRATFRCSASNFEGRSQQQHKIQLVVHESPRFLRKPMSKNVTTHELVEFFCETTGSPQPFTHWFINGNSISENLLPLSYNITNNMEKLTIYNVTRYAAFNVQCNISNAYGYQLAGAYLNVFSPTEIETPPEDVVLSDQSFVVFHCGVKTDPATMISISWLRGSQKIIYDFPRIYVLSNHSLILNFTNEEDGGNSFIAQYTCLATNGLDSVGQSARLRPIINNHVKQTAQNVHPWFPLTFDALWLGVVCGLVCLIIISITTTCIVFNCRRRSRKKQKSSNASNDNVKMQRLSKHKPNGIISESNHLHVNPSLIENAGLQDALRQMYIPRNRIRMGNSIGRGQFGRVYSALLCHARDKLEEHVAVKTMKYKPEETEMAELFLREAILMKDFWHVHVLGVIGVTFDPDGSPMVILPFMANGDLRKYIMNTELDITVLQLLKMSLQVAHGMAYLSSMRFVHRDLAARNCMVDEHGLVKVADFGLSRELILCDYYRLCHNKTPVPVRWMAPECLEANVFTTMSDVWSFGVLLWELVTRGAVPFSDLENWEVASYIQSGKRLPQPLYCPDSVYSIMQNCWQEESYTRPTFDQIACDVEEIIQSAQSMSAESSTSQPLHAVYTNTNSDE